jgi:hypothetical protein
MINRIEKLSGTKVIITNFMSKSPLYETDFMDWLTQQKLALVSRDITALDWENLAEELDSMGISEKNELKNRGSSVPVMPNMSLFTPQPI